MFNKFSRLLTLSTTVLSLGLAATSATFAKTSLTPDQLLKFSQLSQFFKVSIEKNIKTAGEVAHKYRGSVINDVANFTNTNGGDAGNGIGEVNLSALDGLGAQPPVVSVAVFNLNGSPIVAAGDNPGLVVDDANNSGSPAVVYDKSKTNTGDTYSALVMKITDGATGISGIDGKYVIIPLYHGAFTDTNTQQQADLSGSMKTKCFTNMSALQEFADFAGDNTALENQGLLTKEGVLDISEMSKFVGNCQRVNIDVELNDGKLLNATNAAPAFIRQDSADALIDKVTLTYVN